MRPLQPRYSGKLSKEFWKRVNALPPGEQERLYTAGCILQNVEGDVLRWLAEAQREEGR